MAANFQPACRLLFKTILSIKKGLSLTSSINPRTYLAQNGNDALTSLLRGVGYRVQPNLVRDLCHVLKTGLPWLISGPRGGGKSALAEALAEACGLQTFYLQGMEGLRREDVIGYWDREAQKLHMEMAVRFGNKTLDEAEAETVSRRFFRFGDPLAAYAYTEVNPLPPVLILDEVDKLTEPLQDMLLQMMGRGFGYVAGLGNIGNKDRACWPLVVLLSNDIRYELSAPLRSRCLFSLLPMPTIVEQAEILALRCPQASPALVRQVAKVLNAMQAVATIKDKPGPREAIELLKALVADGVESLDEQVLNFYVAFMVKQENDHVNYLKATRRLVEAANVRHALLDNWNLL